MSVVDHQQGGDVRASQPLDRLLAGQLLGRHEQELDLLSQLLQALFSLTLGDRRGEAVASPRGSCWMPSIWSCWSEISGEITSVAPSTRQPATSVSRPSRADRIASSCPGRSRSQPKVSRASFSTRPSGTSKPFDAQDFSFSILRVSRGSANGSWSSGRMPASIARPRSSSALNSAPSRIIMFEIHSQTRKMIGPASAP
jgi:hypothetical protein